MYFYRSLFVCDYDSQGDHTSHGITIDPWEDTKRPGNGKGDKIRDVSWSEV